jgi:hypothetical protein
VDCKHQFYFERGEKSETRRPEAEAETVSCWFAATKAIEESGWEGKEFVIVDPRGDSAASLTWLNSNNLRETVNVDIARLRDFAGQSENEFDGFAGLKLGVRREVDALEANVAGQALPVALPLGMIPADHQWE